MMVPYLSRTGTKSTNVAAIDAGWGILVSARGVWRFEGFPPGKRGGDNGAWTASEEFRKGLRPTPDPCLKSFEAFVDAVGSELDWLVVPDIVRGGARSWAMTRFWLRKLRRDQRLKRVMLMIAVQDGFEFDMVAPFLGPRVGVFVGGSTEWKEATAAAWCRVAHSKGAECHVGRVNTARRVHICAAGPADRFDGASATLFSKTLPHIDRAARQYDIEGYIASRAA